MTRAIMSFVAVIVVTMALYLMGAFVAADFDITTWGTEGRGYLSALWFATTFVILAIGAGAT